MFSMKIIYVAAGRYILLLRDVQTIWFTVEFFTRKMWYPPFSLSRRNTLNELMFFWPRSGGVSVENIKTWLSVTVVGWRSLKGPRLPPWLPRANNKFLSSPQHSSEQTNSTVRPDSALAVASGQQSVESNIIRGSWGECKLLTTGNYGD